MKKLLQVSDGTGHTSNEPLDQKPNITGSNTLQFGDASVLSQLNL